MKGSNVGLVRVVDLMFASFVTSSSVLIGLATRRAEERMAPFEGANANAADAEQSAVITASEENCMVVSNFS